MWAQIWGQNRVIGWVLVAHLLALVVVRTVAYTKERTTSPCSAPYDPRPWMVASWAVPLEFDALTFGSVLMSFRNAKVLT